MATNANSSSRSTRKYDFVIFGATGFTGQYTIEEMIRVRTAQTSKFTWAVAGRNEKKLKESIANAYKALNIECEDVPTVIADVNDGASLAEMCRNTKIVLNCVGPYRFYGEPVVKACVENKAHHIDISGEPGFLERIQLDYHQRAKDAGVYILGSCGFDSIPCEMGLQLMRQNFPGDIAFVEMYVSGTAGPDGYCLNYGTYLSAIHGFAQAKELGSIRSKLLPQRLPRSKFGPPKKGIFFYEDTVDGWCIPLPAADKPVALRTMYHEYVEHKIRPFQLNTYFRVGTLFAVLKMILVASIFGMLATYRFGRTLLEKFPHFFSGGTVSRNGPTRQQVKGAGFVTTLVGVGYTNKLENATDDHKIAPDHKIYVKVKGPEPGYIATPICMIQAGLVLLEEIENAEGRGGVYTPGVAFANTTLVQRLKKNGIDFICGAPIKINESKL